MRSLQLRQRIPGEPVTYADMAASDHCWINREDFDTYQPLASREGAGAPVGSTFPIAGVGTVRKSVTHNGKQVALTFENSLHTPTLQHNLVSIGRLDRVGYSATFGGGKVMFHDPKGHPFMSGHGRGTMYVLELKPPEPQAYAARSHNKPTDLETWHRRFGHASEAGVRELASKGMVEGLNITSLETRGRCEDCIYGKHARRPFDEVVTPETEVLERAHLDLWGKACVQSMGGKSYMMLIEDGGSSHMEGYFLDSKSAETTLAAFSHYHVTAERQTGRKLKYVRTDGGPEWVNELWVAYFEKHGIIHETTPAYSSAANGVAERGIRMIIERVRCGLRDAGLAGSVWAETAATMIYLRDFLPMRRHPGKVPHEIWYKTKPDVSHLRAFGCVTYAKIPKEHGVSKLEPCSIKTVLIGYYGRGAYRLLDQLTGRIIKSRDVIFEEGSGHRTLPSVRIPPTEGESSFEFDDPVVGVQAPAIDPADHADLDPDLDHDVDVQHGHHGLVPAHEPEPPAVPPAPAPAPIEPVPLRRSTRPTTLSRAAEDLAEFTERENAAAASKKDWASTSKRPTGLAVQAYITMLNDSVALAANPNDNWIPNSYREAITREDLWRGPMDDEIARMHERKVWHLVDRPKDANVMKNRWSFANKYDVDGGVVARKARLVAKGFTQIPGIDYFETYASVVRYESLRMNLAIAAAEDMEAWQVDFVGAYLNAPMREVVLMEQPEGYMAPGTEGKVAQLDYTLYGTMQGANNWWDSLDKEYRKLGYYRSKADTSVRSRDIDGEKTITSTYTDDVTGISSSMAGAEQARAELGLQYEIKDLGESKLILGIRVDRDRAAGTISISQRTYIERVLARHGMSDCNPRSTPLPTGVVLNKSQAPTTEEEQYFMRDKPYREVLGAVMYAQIATRPDVSYAVATLSKFASNPGPPHWAALMHVLQYLKGTLHYKITYGGEGFTSLAPIGYVDADYAGDTDTRRSCAGHVFVQAGGPTAWGAQYQPTVALSTTEAEYMSLTRSAKQVQWMYSAMDEVGFPQPKPAVLKGDNRSANALAKNTKHNSRVKHIDIRHHYVRERVKEGDIIIEHVPSIDNPADLFTKPLTRAVHHGHCLTLRLCED